jgi:molybdate transport system substrate-binding protein
VFDETGDERIEVIEKGIATALSWVRTELGLGNVAVARILDPSLVRFTQPIRRVLLAFILIILLGSTWGAAASAQEAKLVVFGAASLKDALDAVNAAYRREKSQEIITSYAASSTLAKQIEAAAPADIFISADLDWMDYLAKKNLIKPETRANLLGNKFVLIAPADSAVKLGIAPNFPLAQALGDGRLATADPNGVPAGKYGKASLQALGVWSSVADKLAPTENVRAALLLVSRGEAPLGIVYRTDAVADKEVKILGRFPDDTHPLIIYPIAAVASSTNSGDPSYIAYLRSPAAGALFEKHGFTVLK